MIATSSPSGIFPLASNVLQKYGWQLALASAFFIPIKLTIGYFTLFPLILLWILGGDLSTARHPISSRLLLFAAVAAFSGILGIAPLRTLTSSLRLTLSLLAVPAVAAVSKGKNNLNLILAAMLGQTIAATATCIELGLEVKIPRYFTGPVTESGQLAIIIPLVAAIIICGDRCRSKEKIWGAISLIVMNLALLLNAKRGPFIASVVGLSVLFVLRSPRLLIPLILTSIGAIFFVPSLHQRLSSSLEHFFIAGGRNEMWSIGMELISRYPLGIGFHNSPYLQKFSLEVPPEHSHFHSNLINILVETGWIGLAVFITWWCITLAQSYKRGRSEPLAIGVFAALISWQVAGLVEYNIGDSEVFVPLLIQVGGLLGTILYSPALRQNKVSQVGVDNTHSSMAS